MYVCVYERESVCEDPREAKLFRSLLQVSAIERKTEAEGGGSNKIVRGVSNVRACCRTSCFLVMLA